MARELFIYWRVAAAHLPAAKAAALQMQAELRERHPGLVARLYLRADAAGEATLMETYAALPQGAEASLEAAARLAVPQSGQRHVEVFDELDPR